MPDIDLDDTLSYSVVLWMAGINGYRHWPRNSNHFRVFTRRRPWLEGAS